MITRNFFSVLSIALGVLATTSCSDDDTPADPPAPRADLTFNIIGLQELTNGATYEGWIIVDGEPISTGRFDKLEIGQKFSVEKAKLDEASDFTITIEGPDDDDKLPSDTKILSGSFANNVAVLDIDSVIADFNGSSGKFVMATPTDNPGTPDNDQFGLWFMDPNGGSPIAGLDLPELPKGWKYEGWLVTNDTPVTTGTFSSVDGKDDSSPYSGNEDAPDFPGEDFLNTAPAGLTFPQDGDVRGKQVVVSIEPFPDYDQAKPFYIKPLSGTAGTELFPTTNNLALDIRDFPSGRVLK